MVGTSGISFSGLATGLDTKAIIDALVGVRRKPILLLEARKSDFNAVKTQFETFRAKLGALRDAADALRQGDEFLAFSAASSVPEVLGVSADGSASASSFTVTVNALAQGEVEVSQGYADFDATSVGTGTLSISVAGTAHDIAIASGADTLEGVAEAINDAEIGVSATIVNTGTGTAPYQLVLSADETGAENTIVVAGGGLSGGAQALSFTQTQAGTNASLSVNGVTVQRSTNVIDDVVSGVTFTLLSTGASTVTLNPDTEAMKSRVQTYVNAHNELIDFVNGQLTVDEDAEQAGALSGELLVRTVTSNLLSLHARSGFPGGSLSTLSQAGVELTKDGKLAFDGDTFDAAADENLEDLVALFATRGDTVSGAGLSLVDVPDAVAAGSYAVSVTQSATKAETAAAAAMSQPLAADEKLTFTSGAKVVEVQLTAGDTVSQVVAKINSALAAEDLDVTASEDGGVIEFSADDYGSAGSFSVVSDQAAQAGSTGVGTSVLSASGQDVAGTIGGLAATGNGQVLTGTGALDGVEVRYTGAGAGSGEVTVGPDGFFTAAHTVLDDAVKPVTGSIDARLEALGDTMRDIDDRIDTLEDRLEDYRAMLERKFAALEAIIGNLQAQQTSLLAFSSTLNGNQN
jgi:flagellar hook-associated protein 2